MNKAKTIALILFVITLLAVPMIVARYMGTHTIVKKVDCLKCHADIGTEQASSVPSAHRTMSCSSCHPYTPSFHNYTLPVAFGTMSEACGRCHSSEYTDWLSGAHATTAECWQCHTEWDGTPR